MLIRRETPIDYSAVEELQRQAFGDEGHAIGEVIADLRISLNTEPGLSLVALDSFERRGIPMVFLEGSPAYYSKLGFTPGREMDVRKPSLRIPDAAFQMMPLSTYQFWMTGTVV